MGESTEIPVDVEFAKFSCDLLHKALWSAADLFMKGMAFCLAITAALAGYVISQKLQGTLAQFILAAGIATVVLFSVLAGHMVSGLRLTVDCMEKLMESMSPNDFRASPTPLVFDKFRSVCRTFYVCAALEVGVLVGGMALLMWG
jgi:hypothetical protein